MRLGAFSGLPRWRKFIMAVQPGEPGYRAALIAACSFFMVCSAGMLVFNKLVLKRITGIPITVRVQQTLRSCVKTEKNPPFISR